MLGHEQNGFLRLEVHQSVAVHFDSTKEIVEECFLILGIVHITRVHWHLIGAFKEGYRACRVVIFALMLSPSFQELLPVLLKQRLRQRIDESRSFELIWSCAYRICISY